MAQCKCETAGWCPVRQKQVTRLGLAICRKGDAEQCRRYFEPAVPDPEPVLAAPASGGVEDWDHSLFAKGKRLSKAVARWVAAGRPLVAPAQALERLSICEGDASRPRCSRYRAADATCGACGCGLKKGVAGIPAKTRMATEDCPEGKWPTLSDNEPHGSKEFTMSPLPRTMKAPADKRATWRGGIIQIMVGRACDLACHHCTQGSNLAGKPAMMTVEDFERACDSLQGYPGVIGMFGGNPALHPKFEAFCEILRGKFPWQQRGLWCNHPRGKGAVCRITFNPAHSNLNCHLSGEAYEQFARDWPESVPYLKGMDQDSVHSSPWVAMKDVIADEGERWKLIGACDVNQHWSALVGVVPGRGLRAYFCEIAYTQAAMHAAAADADEWPDTGLSADPGWWRKPIAAFDAQVRLHCHSCGIPLRREGQLAIGGELEEFSPTHAAIARSKVPSRPVQLVELTVAGARSDRPATQYLPGTTPGYRGA